jgi:regulator of replication initiation timing
MAGEVTKKDLQSLQATFTKHIGDVKKQIDEARQEFYKGLEEENAVTVTVNKNLSQRLNDLETKCSNLSDAIRSLSTAVEKLTEHFKR